MYISKKIRTLLLHIFLVGILSCEYSYAKDKPICTVWNVVKICGSQNLLKEITKRKELIISDDPYLAEMKKTAKNLHVISPEDVSKAYTVLSTNDPIVIYWRMLIDKMRESIRFGLYYDDAILESFYQLYPSFPKIGKNGILFRVKLENGDVLLQNKDVVREYCDVYVKNIYRSNSIDVDSKKCYDFVTSIFFNKNDRLNYGLLSSQWVNGYYYESILKRKEYPKVLIMNNKYVKDNSPNIDKIGNIYIPKKFLTAIDVEELKLVMLHEMSHLRLSSIDLRYIGIVDSRRTNTDHILKNTIGLAGSNKILEKNNGSKKSTDQKSSELVKNDGDQLKGMQNFVSNPSMKKHFEKMMAWKNKVDISIRKGAEKFSVLSLRESKKHVEEVVDLIALSYITEESQQSKYIELINRFEEASKGRIDAAKIAIEYIRAGYSPMRLLAINMKRGIPVNPLPLIPLFSINKYMAIPPLIDEKEKTIVDSYSKIIMTMGISKITKYMRKYKVDNNKNPYALKRELEKSFRPAFDAIK